MQTWTRTLWWLIHKDVLRECRARLMFPAMLLMGVVLALVLQMQFDLSADSELRLTSGTFWIAVFFAGTLALDRSIAGERDEGCWAALQFAPVSPATIYLSKVIGNLFALTCLELVLLLVFMVVSDLTPPLSWELPLMILLSNVAIAALGTVCSALTQGIGKMGQLLTLLLLPLALPVLLAASEATRLLLLEQGGPTCRRWIHLLAAAAVVFLTVGMLVFDSIVED